ncbi:MAG: hypothetical protein ACO1PI_04515 [Bacteroidota bacterium]
MNNPKLYISRPFNTTIMASADIIKIYKQLEQMDETKDIRQLKEGIKETLYQNLRLHILEMASIGRVIGYAEVQEELKNAIKFVETQKD